MTRYSVSAESSEVAIEAQSSMHPVHATSSKLRGTLDVTLDEQGRPDLTQPYSAQLSLPVESIRSGNGLQDREMQRRLDVKRYPDITVSVTQASEADGQGRFRARADITVRGETKPVEGEVTFSVTDGRLLIEGEQVIDMRTFGVDPPRLLMIKVKPEVRVRVRVAAVAQDQD